MNIPKSEIKRKALQLARRDVVQAIKNEGGKVSHFSAVDIDRCAKELLISDSSYLTKAEAELRSTVYEH